MSYDPDKPDPMITVRTPYRNMEQHERALAGEAAVLRLRMQGFTFHKIARHALDENDIPYYAEKSGAYRAYRRAIRRTVIEPAISIRDEQVDECDELLAVWMPIALNPKHDLAIQATRIVDRAQKRKAALMGADAPTTVRHVVTDAQQAEIEQLARDLGALPMPEHLLDDEPAGP